MIRFAMDTQQLQTLSLPQGVAEVEVSQTDEGSILRLRLPYGAAYGMGEKFDSIDQKGRLVTNAVVEQFCNQGDKTYCSIPFFFTDTGLGVWIDTLEPTTFDFRKEGEILCQVPRNAGALLYTGTPARILQEWNAAFKPAASLPSYAFGPWISANRWKCREDVEEVRRKLKQYDIPATVLVLEAWSDEATFYIFNGATYKPKKNGEAFSYEDFDFSGSPWRDPKEMIQSLKEDGIATVLWQIPVYKKCLPEEETPQSREDEAYARQEELCIMKTDHTPYRIPEGNWFAGSLIPDFTNDKTRRIWLNKRRYLLDIGVAGFKTDGGEFIYEEDVTDHAGRNGRQLKNAYSQTYVRAYHDFLGKDGILFSRAGYTGAQGTPILWAGDHQSTNDELKHAYYAAISAACSGILFWSFDIGGFAGPLPTVDVYLRSTMFACFCPVMQWHSEPDGGQFKEILKSAEGNNERSPWNMAECYQDPELLDTIRYWHKLRMALIPYLSAAGEEAVTSALPMMRPLFWDAMTDEKLKGVEDAYYLGEALLIAPLLEEGETHRQLYLPEGDWTGFFSRKSYLGGTRISSQEEKYPVFIKRGAKGEELLPEDPLSIQ